MKQTGLVDQLTRSREMSETDSKPVNSGHILVVDDDFGTREALRLQIVNLGHQGEAVASGTIALQRLREEAFDLVLLDVIMPELDGYQVLTEIKQDPSLKHIPVIMVSALDDIASVVRCIESGAEDYLPKPFDPTLLRA